MTGMTIVFIVSVVTTVLVDVLCLLRVQLQIVYMCYCYDSVLCDTSRCEVCSVFILFVGDESFSAGIELLAGM